jgi:hypothetical protein
MTLRELQRYTWRTARLLKSSVIEVPKGTVVTITAKHNGVSISGPKCDHCGCRIFMRRVQLSDLTIEAEAPTA